ncbi:Dihydrofolate reductase [Chryseolinea serpens]|uniref:Dihydrofolate reductase n=1 Tax=Chryseolinea serpens TaxID=947013 RepID=A0A1M5LNB4_9BACT|nr:dihydrofolate reductase family protein [Chryseolinea serpens]SHG66149.1 Dihydrofolate reductase [Chryseolinea serpens]
MEQKVTPQPGKLILDIAMSLDGYMAGPNISATHPLGEDGPRLHRWMFEEKTEIDNAVVAEMVDTAGAVLVGGRTYFTAIDDAWGGRTPFVVPAFVLTHRSPQIPVKGFTFVHDGIESALAQAKTAAGEKAVWLMGGADIIQQYLSAGLVDEMQIHITHILLGGGTRLFDTLAVPPELTKTRVIASDGVTHLRFKVVK